MPVVSSTIEKIKKGERYSEWDRLPKIGKYFRNSKRSSRQKDLYATFRVR